MGGGSELKQASQQTPARTPLVARCAVLCGLIGCLLASHSAACNNATMCAGECVCVERVALVVSAALSCWSTIAALAWARNRQSMVLPRTSGVTSRCPERLFLIRALLCGAAVALLGWSALLGQAHLLLMGAMQGNATLGAWLACEVHRADARVVKPPSPTPDATEERTTTPRRGSATLPRGWRFHRSTGLFEHKRTGRMQFEPPGTGETGSPLCNLPPCDEERALLEGGGSDGFGSDGAKDSGCEEASRSSSRYGRSRTWHDGSRSVGSRKERSRGAPSSMDVWELRAALSAAERGSQWLEGDTPDRRRTSSRRNASEEDCLRSHTPSYSDRV